MTFVTSPSVPPATLEDGTKVVLLKPRIGILKLNLHGLGFGHL